VNVTSAAAQFGMGPRTDLPRKADACRRHIIWNVTSARQGKLYFAAPPYFSAVYMLKNRLLGSVIL
jgi:hypothetical protein